MGDMSETAELVRRSDGTWAVAIYYSHGFRDVFGNFATQAEALEWIEKNGVALMSLRKAKRPRDFSQAAKLVIDVATGQIEDREPTPEEQGKDPAAAALGRKGGKIRASKMTAERRAEIARKAATSRWTRK